MNPNRGTRNYKPTLQMKYNLYLCIAAALVIAVSACGPPSSFNRTAQELLSAITKEESSIALETVTSALQRQNPNFLLVDLRVPVEFERGHIDGAVNIPAQNLLERQNLSTIDRKDITVVLYGRNQEQAHGPWLLLKQLGYDNVRLLAGGYTGIATTDSLSLQNPETARYDFATSFRNAAEESLKAIEAKKIIPLVAAPVATHKTIETKPKAKPQQEEEEGC